MEAMYNKFYTKFFHFVDAVDNGSTQGYNPKFEVKTTIDHTINFMNNNSPFRSDQDAQFKLAIEHCKEELV